MVHVQPGAPDLHCEGMKGGEDSMERMEGPMRRDPAAFDAWLRRNLHAQHDAALREQVPEELVRMAEAVAAERG